MRVTASLMPTADLMSYGSSDPEIDLKLVESLLETWGLERLDDPISVGCADCTVPAEDDYSFVCDLSDGHLGVRVTVLNENGDTE